VVTASPTPRSASAVASHVTVLDAAELRARGITSVADALRDVAGVHVLRSGSFGALTSVFVRGGESDYALVLVDGVQVNQAGGGFDFASLSLDNVERIEVVRGPASALYGSDAVAGVVHVITRTGQGPAMVRASVETGSYAEPRGELVDGVRWSADLWGGNASAGYALALGRDETDGLLAFNNRHVATTLAGTARFAPDAATRLSLALRLSDRRYHYPTDGSGAVVDVNAFAFSDEVLAQLAVSRRVGQRLELEARLGVFESDGGADDAQDSPADTLGFYGFTSLDHFRRASAEVRAHVRVGGAVITGGGELEREAQRSFSESLSQFGASGGRSASERDNRALFLHATAEAGALALHAGGRLEDNERFGTIATWQAGVSAEVPGSGVRVRAAAGRGLKEPTFFENFASGFAVGNPDLDPETSLGWEAGLERSLFGARAVVRATYFSQAFRDLIQYTFMPPAPGSPNFYNVASARSRGVEVDLGASLGVVEGGASWTWLDTEVTDAGFESGPGAMFVEGAPLLRRPAHAWAARASAPFGERARVYLRVSFVGERADRDFSTFPATPVELPGHALLALGGEWRLWPGGVGRPEATLTLRAENALDRSYEEVLGYRAPGRQLYLGVRVGAGG
jgi:vitamin B12 transporter